MIVEKRIEEGLLNLSGEIGRINEHEKSCCQDQSNH
jgi:hypothetical protein